MGHDSHRANLRYVKAVVSTKSGNCVVFSCRCIMHQYQVVLKKCYKLSYFSFHNQMFCISKLLRFGKRANSLRECMHSFIDLRFRNVYVKPPVSNKAWAQSLLALTWCSASPGDEIDDLDAWKKKRQQIADEALLVYTGSWLDPTDVTH